MTAEVAVLNKSAVALAADSKVTIGAGSPEKTYDSVNKIFTLSKVHPVGLMIYGNADFMQYPWETIVKSYRAKKGTKSEPTIDRWATDFMRYVRGYGQIRKKDISANVFNVLQSSFLDVADKAFIQAHYRDVQPNSADYEKILIEELENVIGSGSRRGRLIALRQQRGVVTTFGPDITAAIAEFMQGSKNKALRSAASKFAFTSLFHGLFSPVSSGFVIAGFGDSEVFPALVAHETDGYIGSRIKFSPAESAKVTIENQSLITAFAQREIVQRFMEGIDPGYADFLEISFTNALIGSNISTFEKWAPKSVQTKSRKAAIAKAAQKQFAQINRDAMNYRIRQFSNPTVEMVGLFPKDELAHLAESLVGLTSLHRRVSRDLETVGGPIDVAVISKNDGFIWIKRKHYFKPELNVQFGLNYLRDIKGYPSWRASK
jgi:hypothetical protein